MNDFLTEKNKKAGVLGKLKWVLCGFCILLSLGAIGASEKYIGEGRWGMAATEILLCLLFLYPTFREVQKALRKKKAREIACWFESYAQNTVSFEKLEQELGKGAVKKLDNDDTLLGTCCLKDCFQAKNNVICILKEYSVVCC